MALPKNTRYITIIRPNGEVEQRITSEPDLCGAIKSALGGSFGFQPKSKLVVNDAVMRERVKGRKVYVLEVHRREEDHQFFSIKAPYEVPAPVQERVATPPIRQVDSQVALPEVPAGVDIEPLPVPQRRTWWDADMTTGKRTLRCNAGFDKMMMGLIHSADA